MSRRNRLGADRVITPAGLRPIVEMNVTALLGVVKIVDTAKGAGADKVVMLSADGHIP